MPIFTGRVREERWENSAEIVLCVPLENLHLPRLELRWKSVQP